MACSPRGWWRRFCDERKRYGLRASGHLLLDRAAKRLAGLDVAHVVWLSRDGMKVSLDADDDLELRFLEPDEIRQFADDPANELELDLVERAGRGHDLCFAALVDGRLAAYGWYALGAIEAEHAGGVAMSYPADVAYMYKGFTHPDFRGRRLHALGMGRALVALGDFGIEQLVSIVDWTNVASLRSCERLGYEDQGRRVKLGWGPATIVFKPRAAQARGVGFGTSAERKARDIRRTTVERTFASAAEPEPTAAAVR